jgi:tetratricopeptide (TPR) repeat protein
MVSFVVGILGVSPCTASAQTTARDAQLARVLARGNDQLARQQRRPAERSFARALQLDPESVLGISGLSRALLPPIEAQAAEATGQQVRGAARILLALEAFPEVPRREELQLVEATALVALGRQREALTLLARAPRMADRGRCSRCWTRWRSWRPSASDLACAEDALRLALELDPSAARAMRLADVHLARGDAPRAVPLLFAALRFEGQSVPLHLALSRAQLTAGDARGADATLGRVITRCPRQCGLLRARVALESSQPARAAELARGLLTLPPDAAEAAAAGNAEPDHRAEAGYLLGLALARDGRRDDAREALEDALQRDPEHRGARQALRAIAPAPP